MKRLRGSASVLSPKCDSDGWCFPADASQVTPKPLDVCTPLGDGAKPASAHSPAIVALAGLRV